MEENKREEATEDVRDEVWRDQRFLWASRCACGPGIPGEFEFLPGYTRRRRLDERFESFDVEMNKLMFQQCEVLAWDMEIDQ